MDMSLSKLPETVKDREAWCAAVHRVAKSWSWLSDWAATIFLDLCLLRTRSFPPPSLTFPMPRLLTNYWSEIHSDEVKHVWICSWTDEHGVLAQKFSHATRAREQINWIGEGGVGQPICHQKWSKSTCVLLLHSLITSTVLEPCLIFKTENSLSGSESNMKCLIKVCWIFVFPQNVETWWYQ